MKQFIKGFSIQLCINLIAHLIRIGIAYLIIKLVEADELENSISSVVNQSFINPNSSAHILICKLVYLHSCLLIKAIQSITVLYSYI